MQRAQARLESRRQLVAAARNLFESVPYEDTTIRSIAQSMGRSTGLVFAHFPDKESLWRAAMGTPPPVDSALTRAAPLLLESLEALIDRRLTPGLDEDEEEELWRDAQRAIEAARGTGPGGAPTTELRVTDFPSKRLNRFGAHVAVEVETRRGLPRWKDIMEPVYELCAQLMAYAEHKVTEAEVYEAAVSAGATIAQVGVHGTEDVPYRSVGAGQRKAKPAAAKRAPTKRAVAAQ